MNDYSLEKIKNITAR